jgi:hypothetical protein
MRHFRRFQSEVNTFVHGFRPSSGLTTACRLLSWCYWRHALCKCRLDFLELAAGDLSADPELIEPPARTLPKDEHVPTSTIVEINRLCELAL